MFCNCHNYGPYRCCFVCLYVCAEARGVPSCSLAAQAENRAAAARQKELAAAAAAAASSWKELAEEPEIAAGEDCPLKKLLEEPEKKRLKKEPELVPASWHQLAGASEATGRAANAFGGKGAASRAAGPVSRRSGPPSDHDDDAHSHCGDAPSDFGAGGVLGAGGVHAELDDASIAAADELDAARLRMLMHRLKGSQAELTEVRVNADAEERRLEALLE